jgi:phospholipase/carboxylesterase
VLKLAGSTAIRSALLAAVLGCVVALHAGGREPAVILNPGSGLRSFEVGTGALPFVLLHGYGSSPEQWLPFCETIHVSSSRRFVFPEATFEVPEGPDGARGWWRLDLASYRRGSLPPDFTRSRPAGLDEASRRVRLLLRDVDGRLGSPARETILGGFSQGAMVSADIAFRTDEPLRALVLLSGTTLDEARWTEGMPARRGLPVFIAHGRSDDVLPFAVAARLEGKMRAAGLRVTWVPFDGGHQMPASVVTALNAFLASVSAGP